MKRERERKRDKREIKWNRQTPIRKKLEVDIEGHAERAGKKTDIT